MKNTRSKTYTNSEFVFLDMDYATAFKRFSSMAGPCHINNSLRDELFFECSDKGFMKINNGYTPHRYRSTCFDYVVAQLTDDYGKAKLEICDVRDRSEILSYRICSLVMIIFSLIYCCPLFFSEPPFPMKVFIPLLAMLALSVLLFIRGEMLAKNANTSDLSLMRQLLKDKIELVKNEKLWSEDL